MADRAVKLAKRGDRELPWVPHCPEPSCKMKERGSLGGLQLFCVVRECQIFTPNANWCAHCGHRRGAPKDRQKGPLRRRSRVESEVMIAFDTNLDWNQTSSSSAPKPERKKGGV